MKVLVVSDSHGVVTERAISTMRRQGKFEVLIHCGDGSSDSIEIANELNIPKIIRVRGNCDYLDSEVSNKEEFLLGNKKFFVCHGHSFHVKSGFEEIKDFANNNDYDAILYGHTHIAKSFYFGNTLIFNPGSLSLAYYTYPSFGILSIQEDCIIDEIVEV